MSGKLARSHFVIVVKDTHCNSGMSESEVDRISHGCAEFGDWDEALECKEDSAIECTTMALGEQKWFEEALCALRPDHVGKWRKKTSKGKRPGKLPRKTSDDCIVLGRWVCNGLESSGCKAQLWLLRKANGHLCVLRKHTHTHDQVKTCNHSLKRGLPLSMRVELMHFIESDLVVPKIMGHPESKGFDLDGISKRMVKNYLIYQRCKHSSRGTIGEVQSIVGDNLFDPNRQYEMDEVFIVDQVIPNDADEVAFFQGFRMSLSCPQMVSWAKAIARSQAEKQMTVDATLKIFTRDKFILLASGVSGGGDHWFPIIYCVVPSESQETTLFHMRPIWKLLDEDANSFFDGLYVLKDAGAGLHSGVRAFFEEKRVKWNQQDCYAHLRRVDGNLQQACKKYGVTSTVATVISTYIRQICFAPNKAVKQSLMDKFEVEFQTFKEFMKWWKSTYGGPFLNWTRNDAPRGYPVSNQGHESNNRTFKKVHTPTRATHRRLDSHEALKPLYMGISSLVREKQREYVFPYIRELTIDEKSWEDVDVLLMSADWALRQEVNNQILLPSQNLLEHVYKNAQELTRKEVESQLVHSTLVKKEYLRECERQVQRLLTEKAMQYATYGIMPLASESLKEYSRKVSNWTLVGEDCTCFRFIEKGVCQHGLGHKLANGNVTFPATMRILHRSRTQLMRMQYVKHLTRKQTAQATLMEQRRKRFRVGTTELEAIAAHASSPLP